MDLGLTGHRAVVVGGAGTIGRAIARAFLEEGADVIVADASGELDEAIKSLGSPRCRALHCDVTDDPSVAVLAEKAFEGSGPIDLVYAAAIGSGAFGMPYWQVGIDRWSRVFEVNVVGAARVAHAFGPRMAERGTGTILLIASVAGQIGSPTDPPYSASKAALINFGQCMAKDLAPRGVRVNNLNPGMVDTPLNRGVHRSWVERHPEAAGQSFEDWATEKIQRLVPMGRWQSAKEIGDAAVFLASERARNVTGQTINVDGGYVMHW